MKKSKNPRLHAGDTLQQETSLVGVLILSKLFKMFTIVGLIAHKSWANFLLLALLRRKGRSCKQDMLS